MRVISDEHTAQQILLHLNGFRRRHGTPDPSAFDWFQTNTWHTKILHAFESFQTKIWHKRPSCVATFSLSLRHRENPHPPGVDATRVAVARSNVSSVVRQDVTADMPGHKVKRSAKPLLDRLDITAEMLPHLGKTPEDRESALDVLKVEQMEGGENHGKYVVHDLVAQLMGKRPCHMNDLVKTKTNDLQRFPSRTEIPGGNMNVSV